MPLDPMKAAIRIHPVFVREDWTWAGLGVPSVYEIAKTIHHLAEMAETHGVAETGRIIVQDDDLGVRVLLQVGDEFDD